MITHPKVIYKRVAENNQLSPEMVESIGTVVFQHLRACLNDPRDLAYELPEIGTFSIRCAKFEGYFNFIKDNIEEQGTENYRRAQTMCEMIAEYRKDKQEVRQKRYEENKTIKPSEDNSEEH